MPGLGQSSRPEEIDAADGQAFSSDSEGEVPVARGRQLERVWPCGVYRVHPVVSASVGGGVGSTRPLFNSNPTDLAACVSSWRRRPPASRLSASNRNSTCAVKVGNAASCCVIWLQPFAELAFAGRRQSDRSR